MGYFLFSFFFLSPPLSFASSRQQIIDNALTETESNHRPENHPEFYRDAPPKKNIPVPPEISEKRKIAIENALYIAAGYDLNHIHYSEWEKDNENFKLDEDFGYQNGFYVNLGYKSPRYSEMFYGRPFLEGYFRKYGATIQYKGATFDPDTGEDTGPFNFKQKSDITLVGLKIGAYLDLSEKGEFFMYVDGGKRIWNRGENEIIDRVFTFKEKYEWWYYGIGLGVNYKVLPKLSLGVDWTGWLTSQAKMKAYDEGETFRLRRVWGTQIKLPIKYYLLEKLSLDVTPYYTYWRINQSDPIPIQGSNLVKVEPDSNTNELGVLFGFTYAL